MSGGSERRRAGDASLISFLFCVPRLLQYAFRLELPLKGIKNDLDEHKFFPFVISADPHVGQEHQDEKSSSTSDIDIPPDYFSLEYDDDGDEKDEKKEKR